MTAPPPTLLPSLVIAADTDRHAISVRVAKRISVNVGEPERKPITNPVRVGKPEPEPVRNGIDFGLSHSYCVYISYALTVRELLRLPLSVRLLVPLGYRKCDCITDDIFVV